MLTALLYKVSILSWVYSFKSASHIKFQTTTFSLSQRLSIIRIINHQKYVLYKFLDVIALKKILDTSLIVYKTLFFILYQGIYLSNIGIYICDSVFICFTFTRNLQIDMFTKNKVHSKITSVRLSFMYYYTAEKTSDQLLFARR